MFSRIVSMLILPAQLIGTRFGKYMSERFTKKYLENSRNDLINNLKHEEFNIQTKDGVKLNGMLFRKEDKDSYSSKIIKIFQNIFKKNQNLKRKVWINFNGNGMCYEFSNKNKIRLIQSLGFDFLGFNYRSVVKSEGKPTQRGLIEDGKTILKYANSLGYDDLYIHAHSLGGAIATKAVVSLKQESPYNKIRLIADRTFSSIKAVLKTYNVFLFIKLIAIMILKLSCWNIKVKNDWDKIDSKKCLFYSLSDVIINENSALFKKVKNSTDQNFLIELKNYGHCDELTPENIKKAISIVE